MSPLGWSTQLVSVLWHCWMGGRKDIRPVKNMGDGGGGHWLVQMEWRQAGWSVCLPLLISPRTMKSRSSLLAPTHPDGPGKRAVKLWWWWWWWLIYSSRYERVTPQFHQLRWLKLRSELTSSCPSLVTSVCMDTHWHQPIWLANSKWWWTLKLVKCLWSPASSSLIVCSMRLSSIGEWAFPVAATYTWNGLPWHITSASSLPVFRACLMTYLFSLLFRQL